MNLRVISVFLLPVTLLLLTACGSSDDGDSTYPQAYVQFYNGSANSASTGLYLDDVELGDAAYGDATSLFTVDEQETLLSLKYEDTNDALIELMSLDVSLSDGYKSLYLMLGDYADPDLIEHQFKRSELEDHFTLQVTSAISERYFDLYIGEAGASITQAYFIGALNYGELLDTEYWDADSDGAHWDLDDYVVYLTEPGTTEVVFESDTMSFDYETEYVMVIRHSSGASEETLIADLIINSSSVPEYKDIRSGAHYRFYNSLNDEQTLNLTLSGSDMSQSLEVPGGVLSPFTSIKYGDYQLSASTADGTVMMSHRLLTLNQGESKTVVLYTDEDNNLDSLAFEESDSPQVYEHDLNVVNLVQDFSNIDVYFVRQDETVETAKYSMLNLSYAESDGITLPSDYYDVIALYDDNSGNQTLIAQTSTLAIDEAVSYLFSIQPDVEVGSGYRIVVLN
ncbi:DUF4397 domain-containing protein [Lacimicrobium sp. SS2-24]|uniref:DUF4397 domain-containing protein n=1 Tax=Lacimicrobium sp. SS2-24 TaxID=2005569 RepID=UPI000B4A6893|nr:DUF4397 domain-containing protein [Lacimicrobium sp. SS2-24]